MMDKNNCMIKGLVCPNCGEWLEHLNSENVPKETECPDCKSALEIKTSLCYKVTVKTK